MIRSASERIHLLQTCSKSVWSATTMDIYIVPPQVTWTCFHVFIYLDGTEVWLLDSHQNISPIISTLYLKHYKYFPLEGGVV